MEDRGGREGGRGGIKRGRGRERGEGGMEGDVDIVSSKWRNQVASMSHPGAVIMPGAV